VAVHQPVDGDEDSSHCEHSPLASRIGERASASCGQTLPAVVDRVREADPDGVRVVDLLVGPGAGGFIAREAMGGHIALILTSRRGTP
jgi:hypothetical protein